jgi:hypothetical protein
MRSLLSLSSIALLASVACWGCSSSTPSGGFGTPGFTVDGGAGSGGDSSTVLPGSGDASQVLTHGDAATAGDTGVATTVTLIYADTDTALYTLDPQTNTVALVGNFTGFSGASGDDGATDCAVDAEGDVYINSETVIYKATLPAGGTGTVALSKIASIAVGNDQSFYALAFAPAGVLGSGETLVGGDNNGELWTIDTSSGAIQDLGNFGANPSKPKDILGLSGDIVFYMNSSGQPTGLATIRSCDSSGSDCTSTDDYLAGIDMTALQSAYTSRTPSSALLAGVYGGGSGSVGQGTGVGELFGLGAWEGSVYGFSHKTSELYTISPSSGVASPLTSVASSGWAGAGVSTKVTITVAPPPAAK